MFIRVIVASDDRQLLHIKTGLLEFLNGRFGFGVRFVYRHDAIVLGHELSFRLFGSLFYLRLDTRL